MMLYKRRVVLLALLVITATTVYANLPLTVLVPNGDKILGSHSETTLAGYFFWGTVFAGLAVALSLVASAISVSRKSEQTKSISA